MILACELRTDKNFTLEEIQSGTLKDFLKPEDYDLEKRVSNLLTYFSLDLMSLSGYTGPILVAHPFPPKTK